MEEFNPKLILDGNMYKLSYVNNKKQQKVSIKNIKEITIMGARKITEEVKDIIDAKYSFNVLCSLYSINIDAKKAGYSSKIIKYQNISIELAIKILYPDSLQQFKETNMPQNEILKNTEKPLEILNIGCTAVGKTLFILRSILSDEVIKNFLPSLTSIKETTACSIIYHINSKNVSFLDNNNFKLCVELKPKEEISENIKSLIIEAIEEYIETIRSKSKDCDEIKIIREDAVNAVEKRLELNYDKTFGLGHRNQNKDIAKNIEKLAMQAILDYYGNSKSIERLVEKDADYIVKQLVIDFREEKLSISIDKVFALMNQYKNDDPFTNIEKTIYLELKKDLEHFNSQYNQSATEGKEFSVQGICEEESTLSLISCIFGNKKLQRNPNFYTIEPFVKKANFFFEVERLNGMGRELVLSDSVGINQGQKSSSRLKEIAFNRVQESIQEREPDIIIYHTKLVSNDDYLLDVIKNLSIQGYGKVTYIVAGRLDTILQDRLSTEEIDPSDFTEEEFGEFINEIKEAYIEKDNVTLSAIIDQENYLLCDKSNWLHKNLPYAMEYECPSILDNILKQYEKNNFYEIKYNNLDFIGTMQKNFVFKNVYASYLRAIPLMIPFDYNKMRWNTLQKAIETLYSNAWGFNLLYPALILRELIALELNKEENRIEFEKLFGENSDTIKRTFLLKVGEAAQIVLVTEYKTFMLALLKMRYDITARTNLSTSMTNDRKYNLQRLYSNCFEQEGLHGEYSMKILFHIAWIRTVELMEKESNILC